MDYLINILNYKLLYNELWRVIVSLLILLSYFPISSIIIEYIRKKLNEFANKTKGRFDNYIIESLSPSLKMFTFAFSFYFATSFLVLETEVKVITAKIFSFLVIVPIVFFVVRFVTAILTHFLQGNGKRSREQATTIDLIVKMTRISLFLIWGLLILSNLWFNISALIAGLWVGGIAFALAAQDLLKNLFSGIALIFDKTFYKWDRVYFQDYDGNIEEVNLRSTKVRTRDGAVLTIPNAMLSDNIVENVAKAPMLRETISIGVTYDTSTEKLKKAKEIIYNAIQKEDIQKERCWVHFTEFGDFSLIIKARFFTKNITMKDSWGTRNGIKDRINFEIKKEFEKEGIEIAFPTQTIEIKR